MYSVSTLPQAKPVVFSAQQPSNINFPLKEDGSPAYSEIYAKAMEVKTKAEAAAYLEALVTFISEEQGFTTEDTIKVETWNVIQWATLFPEKYDKHRIQNLYGTPLSVEEIDAIIAKYPRRR